MSSLCRVVAASMQTPSVSFAFSLTTHRINDNVMELLIMISACKGGSAKSVTGQNCYSILVNRCAELLQL